MACKERILSDEYADILLDFLVPEGSLGDLDPCNVVIDDQFVAVYVKRSLLPPISVTTYLYNSIPKLYGLMQDTPKTAPVSFDPISLIKSGILQLQRPPLSLTGEGVILGFIDTGIRYEEEVFRNPDGTTRILSIWDQTIQEGSPPGGFYYGTEYTANQINEALLTDTPHAIVPSTDEIGHGTAVASVAAGSSLGNGYLYTGAAPEAQIVVVKLKQAKQYLRDYYFVPEDIPAYEETDIGMAVKYLEQFAIVGQRPVVICLALGTNWGDHAGGSVLSRYLSRVASKRNRAIVVSGGNEGNAGHHFYRFVESNTKDVTESVEVRVGPDEKGFLMELWGNAPNIFKVSIRSPGGESLPVIDLKTKETRNFTFVYEKTKVTIDHILVEQGSGEELVVFRLQNPTPGVWIFMITLEENISYGSINMWLPITQFLHSETYFLRSTPNITLTEPSMAEAVITPSTYNDKNNSFFIDSGRGFSRTAQIKPDFAAPGVDISTILGNQTGSSMSAAITAGASAQFMQWAVIERNEPLAQSNEIKTYFIRGAIRDVDTFYPSRSWGYGRLDVARAFQIIAGLADS